MKIYTVQRMNKFDYDFSVEVRNYGCYKDKEKALQKAKAVYENMCGEYEDEMERYSDTDEFIDEDDGALQVEKDEECGFYRIAFGFEQDYESHCVYIDEWNLED